MIISILILYTCLLIALVVTIPTQQEVLLKGNPALFWDQANNRNAKIPIDVRISKIQSAVPTISLPNPAGPLYKENQPNSVIDQLLYNSVINNPGLLHILRGFQSSNHALQNEMQNSERIPNIINNYIILPPEVLDSSGSQVKCAFNNPNSCIRVKKNASKRAEDVPKTSNQSTISDTLHLSEFSKKVVRNKQNLNKNQQRTHVPKREETVSAYVNNHSNKKDLMKNALKKSLHEKNKSKLHNHLFKTKEFQPKQHSLNETWSNEDINTNIRNEIEDTKIAQQQEENGKSLLDLQSPLNVINKANVTNNNRKHKNGLKKSNTTNSKSQIVLQNKKQQEANELSHKKHSKQDKLNNHKNKHTNNIYPDGIKQNINRKNISKNEMGVQMPMNQLHQFSNIHDETSNIHKFFDAFLPNYQLNNNYFSNDIPLYFKNLHQISQPSGYKRKFHRRRKQHKRKPTRKKVKLKNASSKSKPKVETLNGLNTNTNDSNVGNIVTHTSDFSSERISQLKDSSKTIDEKQSFSKSQNMNFAKEVGNNTSNELLIHNNNIIFKESPYYNSYPSLILGIENAVPIIFENDLNDDYYPDFTEDNDILQLYEEENVAGKYNGNKYNYVSNQNDQFENKIDKKKVLAIQNNSNTNKNSNLFFSENDGNEDKRVSDKATKREGEAIQRSIQFQSPRLLDNPGFKTRKVDEINEKYEPYYYHNVFQNTNDDFNKYYLDDTTEICSTSIIPKNNLKSCNESNHSSTGIKSMRKDSNVETVYAPAKLAKYGLAL